MEEVWKDVVGYEGFYQVSNLGRVKSCSRVIKAGANCNHAYQHLNERILKIRNFGNYTQVILSKEGKAHCFSVHRLVACAFIPNPYHLPCINHKDENRNNNCVNNLEWCTYSYNNTYNGRIDKCRDKISKTLKGRSPYTKTDSTKRKLSESVKKSWDNRRQKEEV